MKSIRSRPIVPFVTSLAALLLPAAAASAGGFEGKVTIRDIELSPAAIMRFTGGQTPADARKILDVPVETILSTGGDGVRVEKHTFTVKGSRVRFDSLGRREHGYAIMNVDNGDMYMVRPGKDVMKSTRAERDQMAGQVNDVQKKVQEAMAGANLTAEQRAALPAFLGGGGAKKSVPDPSVRSLGKNAQVNGSSAAAWQAASGPYVVIGWVTSDHAELMPTYEAMTDMEPGIAKEEDFFDKASDAIAKRGMPTRMQRLDMSNPYETSYSISDVIEVAKGAVDEALVTPPADLPVRSMADMARQHMPQAAPGGAPPGMGMPQGIQLPPGLIPPQR